MALAVRIVTPRAIAFEGTAKSVNAPGEEGDFGVLPHHIALLATLRPGTLTVAGIEGGVGEARKSWKIGLGFAEAGPDRVTILTESCEELLPQG